MLLILVAYQLVWFGCHRAEIDLSDLTPQPSEGGSPPVSASADAGAGGEVVVSGDAGSGAGGAGSAGDSSEPAEGGGGAGAVAGAGGGSDELAGSGGGGGSEPADSDPPRVLSIVPSDGQRGVRDDAKIVIRFSEPMDTDRTVLGAALDGLAVDATWDETGTELSLTPQEPLRYATGTDPALLEAIAYRAIVQQSAQDLAGNALDAEYAVTFYTSRELATRLPGNDALIGYAVDSDNPRNSTGFADPCAGDALDLAMKGFMTFELSVLPPETQDVSRALLTVEQNDLTGDPFQMGDMLLDHVSFTEVGLVFTAAAKTSLGTLFADTTTKSASVDVTAALRTELAERANDAGRLQFRFGFSEAANVNGRTDEVCLRPLKLEASYLIP